MSTLVSLPGDHLERAVERISRQMLAQANAVSAGERRQLIVEQAGVIRALRDKVVAELAGLAPLVPDAEREDLVLKLRRFVESLDGVLAIVDAPTREPVTLVPTQGFVQGG